VALLKKSRNKLIGVHPALVAVLEEAATLLPFDLQVVEGLRSVERQAALVKSGASWTMNSRHLTGHAVDIAPVVAGMLRWDWPLYDKIAPAMKLVAKKQGIELEWGGDWKEFKKDGPHFQLSRKTFP